MCEKFIPFFKQRKQKNPHIEDKSHAIKRTIFNTNYAHKIFINMQNFLLVYVQLISLCNIMEIKI